MPNMSSAGRRDAGAVVFVGAVHEALPAFEVLTASPLARIALVVTTPTSGQGKLSGAVDLVTPSRAVGIPVLEVTDINSPDAVAVIRDADPALLVVVGWTRLIGRALLAVPRHGCVGFHASLLPAHRGRAPVNWAILRGAKLTGNTMMMLDPGTDTGDILDQRPIPIRPEDTCATLYHRVALVGAEMLERHLAALLTGTAVRRPQPHDGGEVLPKRTPEMGVIDWSRTAAELHDWVRALTVPYPGAFTTMADCRIGVWRSAPPGPGPVSAPPGTVLGVERDGVRVATGRGALMVTEMSDAGMPPGDAAQWCRAAGLTAGDRFDPVPPEVARWTLGRGPMPIGVRA